MEGKRRTLVRRHPPATASPVIILMILWSLAAVPPAHANGFTQRIAEGTAGPYDYAIGIWPPSPTTGRLHLAILLTSGGKAVPDALVAVTTGNQRGGQPLGPSQARVLDDPLWYELDLTLSTPGTWEIAIDITAAQGQGTVHATLPVGDERTADRVERVGRVFVPLGLLVLGVFLWRFLVQAPPPKPPA